MKQLIPFDTAKGGNVPKECLKNTRKGYSIPPKYNTAWEAWLNTEKHTDRYIPSGVDVPIYFSYWATINEVYKNWGHIGVNLKDGRFWSDGKIYANLEAYEDTHAPIYAGWGESVNDIKVIEGNKMYPNSGDLTNYYNATGYPGHKPNANDIAYWTTGTDNPNWSKGADHVWKDLTYKISEYVLKHPQSSTFNEVGTIDGKKVYRKA